MAFTEKLLTSKPPIEVPRRARIKRSYVTSEIAPVTAGIEQAAIAPDADGTPPSGFIALHRSGDGAAYPNACTWVWDNVLHMRGAVAAQPELGYPDDDPTHFIVLDRPSGHTR